MIPSTRTRKHFEALGYTVQLVERYIHASRRRYDFLGCIDIIAVKIGQPIIGIQCFSTAWVAHKRKIVEGSIEGEEYAKKGAIEWLSLNNTELWFVGWRKLKLKRGSTVIRWTPRFGKVTLTESNDLMLSEKPFFKRWWE